MKYCPPQQKPAMTMFRCLLVISLFSLNFVASDEVDTEDIARGKPAFQSTTGYGGLASRAVDGNTDSDYGKGSCSHTVITSHQYWYVDLGAAYKIYDVVIYNRMDCCSERLKNTEIYVYNTKPTSWNMNHANMCGAITTSTAGVRTETILCHGHQGRYVAIRKTDSNPLTLCEVKVHGHLVNLALRKPAFQSTTGYGGVASRAVDGNTDSDYGKRSCSHTVITPHQYWYVDLGAAYKIDNVVIYNRMDCCSERLKNTEVYVYPTRPTSWAMNNAYSCGGISTSTAGVKEKTIQCQNRIGRYVAIRKTDGNPLTLCEVEVHGSVSG